MSKRILVVDDNENNRILMRDILNFHGYEVIEAEDGVEALKKAKEEKPALMLLDLQMPVMDGFTAIRKIREDNELKDLIVIAITSFAMKDNQEKALSAGFDGYITKPINTRKLPEIVENFLSNIDREIKEGT